MFVIGAHVERIGIGVNAVRVGLMPGGRERVPKVVAVAGPRKLHEERMRRVILVVAPVAAAFAVPVAVVEIAVFARPLLVGHVTFVAGLDESVPLRELLAERHGHAAQRHGLGVPSGRQHGHDRKICVRGEFGRLDGP